MKAIIATKVLPFLLPLALFASPCDVATKSKSRTHPITIEEIEKEVGNNLHIIDMCQDHPDVIKEAKLYNEYLLFKYLKLPTVHANDDDLIEKCKRVNQ